jgi:hypothetical protein
VAAAVFVAGSFMAWFLWTQQARPKAFHVPVYHPPVATILSGAAAILLLALAASLVRRTGCTARSEPAPRPWLLILMALFLGLPWYGLMVLVFGPAQEFPLLLPMAGAMIWAAGLFLLIRHWAISNRWQDAHRWALCFGALLVCIIGGFLGASTFSQLDLIGKSILNALGIAGMILLRANLARRLKV